MSKDKKSPKGAVSAAPTPDALDLLNIERRITALEKEKAELEAKSKFIPGRNGKLEAVNKQLGQLRLAHLSAQEHVRASLYQSEIYEREKAFAQRDATRQEMLDKKKETAAQTGISYKESLRTYVSNWMKKKPVVGAAAGTSDDQGDEQG